MKKYQIIICSIIALFLSVTTAQAQFTRHYYNRYNLFKQQNDIDSTKIVMLGNSLTEGGGNWNNLLNTENVVNRGISGDSSRGILNRLDQILPYNPKAIFLMCGINDLSHKLTAEKVFDKCKAVIDSIKQGAPNTALYVQSLLPFNESYGRWRSLTGRTDDVPVINQMLSDYCNEQGITFINLFPHFTLEDSNVLMPELTSDGLHLSKQGYKVWTEELMPYIEEINK